MKTRLEKLYKEKIHSQLQNELNIKNVMRVPYISKIVLNIGVKEGTSESKAVVDAQEVLSLIAGQAAVKTLARKSIAGFKLREGVAVGVRVTLRKRNMYDFLDRLISFSLPLIKDFRGVSTKFDGNGNYNLGIKDWMIFPEVDYDKVDKVRGMNITFETSTSDDKEAFALMKHFKMPFKRD